MVFFTGCVSSTCVFGPLQDGRDLVAFLRFADAVASRRADADGVQVGLHAAQERRSGGGAVCDLEVDAVGLRKANSCCWSSLKEILWPACVYLSKPHAGEGVHGHDRLLSGLVLQLTLEDTSCRVGRHSHTWARIQESPGQEVWKKEQVRSWFAMASGWDRKRCSPSPRKNRMFLETLVLSFLSSTDCRDFWACDLQNSGFSSSTANTHTHTHKENLPVFESSLENVCVQNVEKSLND